MKQGAQSLKTQKNKGSFHRILIQCCVYKTKEDKGF